MMLIATMLVTKAPFAQPIDATPDGLVKTLVSDVMNSIKLDKDIQAGNVNKVMALVDAKIVPYTNFQKTTQLAMGKNWSRATPEQQKQITTEFKTLLMRTYAGALTQVKDQTVTYKPFRMDPTDTEVVVKTQVMNKGDAIQIDYRLEKVGETWRLYDLNVLGAWLIEAYRGQFNNQISANGIDGLLKFLQDRNAALAKAK
ncbi:MULTISPECIES: ABC transporter substrate-binding protein [unclassified Polynucleobacter]|uniref:MlaC/ttg2D family ABC transporter substrate-binding protein n=1 Tax=unclassified Polynucleobacter TaxID=2640945 RepID=UPI0024917B80|nr:MULTISPECIES: ABC transporter substrate-binding protein [unclassified Polynucleobacter]